MRWTETTLPYSVERHVEILQRASAWYHHPLSLTDVHHLVFFVRRHKWHPVIWNQTSDMCLGSVKKKVKSTQHWQRLRETGYPWIRMVIWNVLVHNWIFDLSHCTECKTLTRTVYSDTFLSEPALTSSAVCLAAHDPVTGSPLFLPWTFFVDTY